MQSKSLLIAIAAFAVTATGVQAYGGTAALNRSNLTSQQRSAIEEAHELRFSGDREAARDVLVEAGIDEEVLRSLREASREVKTEVREAVESGDYTLFRELIEGTPLEDVITSTSDFEQFQAAHELRQGGNYEEAQEILDELGIEPGLRHGKGHGRGHKAGLFQLTEEQREAVRVAKESNDRETVRAILEEAGVGRF